MLAALVAIPILVHRLGADRFGVLTISWMIAGYFGLFDFGLGRALTKAMAQELSLGRDAKAAELFWTSLVMMLTLGVAAGISLAMIAPWLTRGALKIPLTLQSETLAGFYVIAIGLPILVTASALRAALAAASRFDLLNLIRTPSGIMSFVAPVLMLPFTHNLGWLIGALIANRAASWAIYFAAIFRAFPGLRSNLTIDLACILPLLGFGAWITLSSVITPLMVYLDRILIGSLMSMAALAAYSVPMEIVSKSFILPVAISGVMFPAFARSFAAAPEELAPLFARSLKLVALILCPVCAAVVTFAPQIMWFWIRSSIRRPERRGFADIGGRRFRHRPRMDTAGVAAGRASARPRRENSSGRLSSLRAGAVDRCCEVRVDRRGLHLERAVVDRESDDLRDGDPVCCGIGTRNRRGWRIFSASHWGDYGRGIPSGCS